jgi:hypothetical protein
MRILYGNDQRQMGNFSGPPAPAVNQRNRILVLKSTFETVLGRTQVGVMTHITAIPKREETAGTSKLQ